MKLLVFAHTPPPHHGQSYMVQLLIEGFGGDVRKRGPEAAFSLSPIQVYHVNARVSEDMEDIGGIRAGKFFLLLHHCLHAIWCRLRYGVKIFYYVPAPPKNSALFRDWVVMLLCRPFFPKVIFHWHATGLGAWLASSPAWKTRLSLFLLGRASVSIVLTGRGKTDAEILHPLRIVPVPNGIPDPCPGFEKDILPQRLQRFHARLGHGPSSSGETFAEPEQISVFKVLFLAHCTREKGLFDTLDAVALANSLLTASGHSSRIHLTVAGSFMHAGEELEFKERTGKPDLAASVSLAGFVSGGQKSALLAESDLLAFPTKYSGETLPVLLLEAMAFGLPVVTTTWRDVHKLLPGMYPGVTDPGNVDGLARLLVDASGWDHFENLRSHFSAHYTLESHLRRMTEAILASEEKS